MNQTIYIHIGMPKTGSSAVQAFLTLNHNTLRKKGYLFPDPPIFSQAYQTSSGNMGILIKLFLNKEISKMNGIIKSFLKNRNIILSSETLFHLIRIYPDRFFHVFKNYDYKIICYVRRQDNLISSSYKQLIKNDDVKDRAIIPNITEDLDFCKVLLNTLAYTDSNRIIIRPYEKQQFFGGNIYSDFLNCIGLKFDDNFVLPEKIVNPSFSYDILEFRRILNSLGLDGYIKDKYLINTFLAEYMVNNNSGYPFTDSNIFSPKERVKIINDYKKENEKIARLFLNRQDGKLFYDEVPKLDDPWKPHEELSFETAIDICKYMLSKKYKGNVDKELIEVIVEGTVNKILYSNQINNVSKEELPILYRLTEKPINISKDVVQIEERPASWFIESSGNDPYFTLPGFNSSKNKGILFVKIRITSTRNTVLQLFYLADNFEFDEKYSISRNINKGYNELIIEIKERKPIKSLRLDPGNVKGMYLLHGFEVRIPQN